VHNSVAISVAISVGVAVAVSAGSRVKILKSEAGECQKIRE